MLTACRLSFAPAIRCITAALGATRWLGNSCSHILPFLHSSSCGAIAASQDVDTDYASQPRLKRKAAQISTILKELSCATRLPKRS